MLGERGRGRESEQVGITDKTVMGTHYLVNSYCRSCENENLTITTLQNLNT